MKRFKQFLRKNALWIALLGYLLYQRVPLTHFDNSQIGNSIPAPELTNPDGSSFEKTGGRPLRAAQEGSQSRQVIILWASWCGPCEVQLQLFEAAVHAGLLPAEQVFAVNIGEDLKVVQDFVREHPVSYQTLVATEAWVEAAVGLQATPTVLHLTNWSLIEHISTGLNTFGVLRSQRFLAGE